MSQSVATQEIRAFIPAKDFERSRQFYRALGFVAEVENEQISIFRLGGAAFILQNYYVPEWAGNQMLQLVVEDLQAWWKMVNPARICNEHQCPAPKPPAMQPWGIEVGYIVDPSGVLWHVVNAA